MARLTNLADAEKVLEQFLPTRISRPAYVTEHIVRFLARVNNPQNVPKSIHIAGTSGKTSTAYYAAALLAATGKRVGLLTSPHLERLNERVQINMQPLPERMFCDRLALFLELVGQTGITLSHAELLYAFAFWEFAHQKVDYIVVEVGMGGLLDATNVITRGDKVCIITDIGLDHTKTLGATLAAIATHKAGIIQEHNEVFCYSQPDDAMAVIRAAARQKHAALHIVEAAKSQDELSFLPSFQQRNFILALAAARHAYGQAFTKAQMDKAMHTHIPGRMEVLKLSGKTIILDGAHNQQKLHSLCENLSGHQTAALVAFTNNQSRELVSMLTELAPHVSHLIITTLPGDVHKGRAPEDVAAACASAGIASFSLAHDNDEALRMLIARPEQKLLITGSLYLLRYLRPRLRIKLQQ